MIDLPSSVGGKLRSEILDISGRLSSYPSVSKVILFGSCAQGCNRDDSDVDIAVFLQNNCGCSAQDFVALNRLIGSFAYDIQLQVFSEDELLDPCGIVEEVVSFGITLYDKAAKD